MGACEEVGNQYFLAVCIMEWHKQPLWNRKYVPGPKLGTSRNPLLPSVLLQSILHIFPSVEILGQLYLSTYFYFLKNFYF